MSPERNLAANLSCTVVYATEMGRMAKYKMAFRAAQVTLGQYKKKATEIKRPPFYTRTYTRGSSSSSYAGFEHA